MANAQRARTHTWFLSAPSTVGEHQHHYALPLDQALLQSGLRRDSVFLDHVSLQPSLYVARAHSGARTACRSARVRAHATVTHTWPFAPLRWRAA